MFEFEEVTRTLNKFPKLSKKKQKKFIKNMLRDEDFMEWLFNPPNNANIAEYVEEMYTVLSSYEAINAFNAMFEDTGYGGFNRTHATFIYSIINIAIQNSDERLKELERQKKEGELSKKEAKEIANLSDNFNDKIAELLKYAKKIVKVKAKELSIDSRMPRNICVLGYLTTPDPKYINRFKVGYYLNNLLNIIYAEVQKEGAFHDVKWKRFFSGIFGKDNVVEVCTFILLEGVHRINNYKDSKSVKECWDSLTTFALKELNDAPDSVRSQMVELYIKRIDKMFANRAVDLRVNLLSIDNDIFPKLADTVSRYVDKIAAIFDRYKA